MKSRILMCCSILLIVLVALFGWQKHIVASTDLPAPNHAINLTYFHINSAYGDYTNEVNYVNTYLIGQDDWIFSQLNRDDPAGMGQAFNEASGSGKNIVVGMLFCQPNDTSCASDLSKTLDVAKNYWSDISMFYFDEPGFDKVGMENFLKNFKALITSKGLSQKQIGVNFTYNQLMNGTGYQAPSIDEVGFEAYIGGPTDFSVQNDPNLVSLMNTSIDKQIARIGNRPMSIVIQGYDRNGAWTNMNSLMSIQTLPYLKAYNNPLIKELFIFSYGRTGGTRDLDPCIKTEHERIWGAINNTAQPSSITCSGAAPNPNPNPNPQPGPVVDVLTGDDVNLAHNSTSNQWLAISDDHGKVLGIILDADGSPMGTSFTVNKGQISSQWARVAYSPDAGKYLVTWVGPGTNNLNAQFINTDGSLSGSSTVISSGRIELPSQLVYDGANKKFVLTWSGTLRTIGTDGSAGSAISIGGAEAEVAVGNGEYCVAYFTGSSVNLQSVSSNSNQVSPSSSLSASPIGQPSISYNSKDNTYLVTWTSATGIEGAILNSCNGSGAQQFNIGSAALAVNSYDSITNSFGIYTSGLFIEMDSSGATLASTAIFNDGDYRSNDLVANSTDGTFMAAASLNLKTIKVVSGLGGVNASSNPNVPPSGGTAFPPPANLPIPSQGLPTDLGSLISAVFTWSLSIIGLVIFLRFFYAGFLWFTAAGNSGNVTTARAIMKNAVLGALVLFSAYLILNSINPDLVGGTLKLPGLSGGDTTTAPITPGSSDNSHSKPDQTQSVVDAKNAVISAGIDPTSDDCAAFEITRRAAILVGGGVLEKGAGFGCVTPVGKFSIDIIIFPNNDLIDSLSSALNPQWNGAGTTTGCSTECHYVDPTSVPAYPYK